MAIRTRQDRKEQNVPFQCAKNLNTKPRSTPPITIHREALDDLRRDLMNGPISNESEKLGKRSKWLERALILAGAIVVAGLIGESRTISSCLVTVGVFVEVVLGIFITKTAERMQELANSAIVAAHERVANAEAETARLGNETEELRRDNLKAIQPRRIITFSRDGDQEIRQKRFQEVERYAGTRALIQSVSDPEARKLASDIENVLRRCGWHTELLEDSQSKIPEAIIDNGVLVITLEAMPVEQTALSGGPAGALVELLSLDLGPPVGPPFGVRRSAEFLEIPIVRRWGFEFPQGAVVILVGLRPTDFLFRTSPKPAPVTPPQA